MARPTIGDSKKVPLNLTLSPEAINKARADAKAAGLSISQYIESLIPLPPKKRKKV